MSPLVSFVLGFLAGKATGGFHLFGVRHSMPAEPAFPASHPAPIELPPGIVPVSTSTAVPFREATPAGLPPFPSGWHAYVPTPHDVVTRAFALLGTLPLGATKYEQDAGGTWVAYHASRQTAPDGHVKKFVTAWVPKSLAAA